MDGSPRRPAAPQTPARHTHELEPEPEPAAQAARKAEALRLLNERVEDERRAWNEGRPALMEKHVRAQRAALAAAAGVESWASTSSREADHSDEDTPLVEAAGIPRGDPLRLHRLHNQELRRWKFLSLLLAISLIIMWGSDDDDCPGQSLSAGPTAHGCVCLPTTSVEDTFWGWTEFDGCGWDEDQGWCDVEPGCVGAQEADPASRYGGWDLCLASEVGGSNHSTQGAG